MNTAIDLSQQTVQEILDRLGVAATVQIEPIAGEDAVQIDTTDQAVLIGRGGENLKALQYLVHQLVKRQLPDAPMVTVDVAGYRKARLRKLDVMIGLAKSQAMASSEPVKLAPMNAYERRYIHSVVAEDPDVLSESSGLEPDRRVVIRKAD